MKEEKFKYGIEHEISLVDKRGNFLDYRNLDTNVLNKVVMKFPLFQHDYPYLRIGDLLIKVKRVYIEGLEIFDKDGFLEKIYPKGLELRTFLINSIEETTNYLKNDFQTLKKILKFFNYYPTFISFNPYLDKIDIKIKIHKYERKLRREDLGRITAPFTLLTFGPDINISYERLTDEKIFDIVQKINFYTPFIIPFTFSSPFYKGELYGGYSIRCFKRLQIRPAAVGFVENYELLKRVNKLWVLNKVRIPQEKGRIELKGIDAVFDLEIYQGILALLKGLILDKNLKERSLWPDINMIKLSTDKAFDENLISEGTKELINKTKEALKNDPDKKFLNKLEFLLKKKLTPAKLIIKEYKKTRSINKTLLKFNGFRKI